MKEELVSIDTKYFEKALNYTDYRDKVDSLLAQGLTTGNDDAQAMLEYTRLNVQRMKKWDKKIVLSDELVQTVENISEDQYWLVITEGWCGDAAQNVPLMVQAAALNSRIKLGFVLRDQNLDLMDQFLTNGGRSIPKLIITQEATGDVLNSWGPRPEPMQELLTELKAKGDFSYEEFAVLSHTWYAKDKTQTFQAELAQLLSGI